MIQPLPGIGDMIWHLPHIRAIANHWQSPVTLIAKPRSAADQLFSAEPAVREVIWMDRNPAGRHGRHDGGAGLWRLIVTLRRQHFRRAVLLHHSRSLAFAALAAGIPERYGYGSRGQRWFLNRPPFLAAHALRRHPHEQATAWLAAAGIRLADADPVLAVAAAAREKVLKQLPMHHDPLVVCGIGSSEPYKQWGAARFAELGTALAEAGWRIALVAGPAEASMAEEIRARLPARVETVTAIGWPLGELAALCAEAAFYVGNDTGAMNLAAAVGIRSYGLFGATAPIRHTRRIVAILPADGVPSACDGMARITPAQVLAVIRAGEAAETTPRSGAKPPR